MSTPMNPPVPNLPPPPPAGAFAPGGPGPTPMGPSLDISGTSPIPFWRLCMVELRKSWDTRAGFWLLVAIGILVALVEGFIFVVTLAYEERVFFEDFSFIAGGLTSLLLPVLAIMLVTGEWTQRTAMVSFAIEPRRSRVILAKLAVSFIYVVATLIAMLVIALVLTTICELVQPAQTDWVFSFRDFLVFGLVQGLTMMIGFAFATLLLNTPGSIVLFFAYWYVLPLVLGAIGGIKESLGDALEWINFRAAMIPLLDGTLDTGEEWAKLVFSGLIWLALPFAAGMWRILRAEVK